jgi:hypothetical protein
MRKDGMSKPTIPAPIASNGSGVSVSTPKPIDSNPTNDECLVVQPVFGVSLMTSLEIATKR